MLFSITEVVCKIFKKITQFRKNLSLGLAGIKFLEYFCCRYLTKII